MREIFREGKIVFLILTFFISTCLILFFTMNINVLLYISFLFALLFLFTLIFLRLPTRKIIQNKNCIYASADGNILDVKENIEMPEYFTEPVNRVVIFMHVGNMHWNLAPISGVINYAKHNPGKLTAVFTENSWNINENQMVGIENKKENMKILISMVGGLIARRIRFLKKTDDQISQGEKFGLLRFGSANILYIPTHFKLNIKKGQKTRAGKTVIAKRMNKDG